MSNHTLSQNLTWVDHSVAKVSPIGAAIRLDEETYIDTIIVQAGRSGMNSFFTPDENNVSFGGITAVSVEFSTDGRAWDSLTFDNNPGRFSSWFSEEGVGWQDFGSPFPIRDDLASQFVRERVFVFHTTVPVRARYLKVNFHRADNPQLDTALLQGQVGMSFEVYNTTRSVVSPNVLDFNPKDTAPLFTNVYLRGGDTHFSIRHGSYALVEGTDYEVLEADEYLPNVRTVRFAPAFLATLGYNETVVTFNVGGYDLPVTIIPVDFADPRFAGGQGNTGLYDQTNPAAVPVVNLVLEGNNRLVSITDAAGREIPQSGNWALREALNVPNDAPTPRPTHMLSFTNYFLGSLEATTEGVEHLLNLNFAWGDVSSLEYTLTVRISDGAFLGSTEGSFSVLNYQQFPQNNVVSTFYGVSGGYEFYRIQGLTQNVHYTVNGNTITFTSAYMLALGRGVHNLVFQFRRDDSIFNVNYTLRIFPGSNIDYSIWLIQSQEARDPGAEVPLFLSYERSQLLARGYTPWWYGDTDGAWDTFMTSPRGWTTANAATSRTELRELYPSGDNAFWYHSGYHYMYVQFRVDHVGRYTGIGTRTAISQFKSQNTQAKPNIAVINTAAYGQPEVPGIVMQALPVPGG